MGGPAHSRFSINTTFLSVSLGFTGLCLHSLSISPSSLSDSPSPWLHSGNVTSSDLGHSLPQSHLPPKLAKRLMREAGTLRSRERSLSWEVGRTRSEREKMDRAPRQPNQPATTPFPKLQRPAAFMGVLLSGTNDTWGRGVFLIRASRALRMSSSPRPLPGPS